MPGAVDSDSVRSYLDERGCCSEVAQWKKLTMGIEATALWGSFSRSGSDF